MTSTGSKDQLQKRLEQLSKQIDAAEKKFNARGRLPGGTHMGHLVKIIERHEDLNRQIRQADPSLWEAMKQTWHEDVAGLLASFAKAVKYEDEEFHLGEG